VKAITHSSKQAGQSLRRRTNLGTSDNAQEQG
jgi:hypothetical protein